MPSNLTIKYGNKSNIPAQSQSTAGGIYAAENSVGEIEMYLDTPKESNSERKRLDPRIFVGGLDAVATPAGLGENPSEEAINNAKVNNIWANYDVWIDTSGDPEGEAAPADPINNVAAKKGLMSATAIQGLYDILDQLQGIKLQIVSQSFWNNNATYGSNGTDLSGWLTIVLPDSAVTSGTAASYRPVQINFSNISIVPSQNNGGNGS